MKYVAAIAPNNKNIWDDETKLPIRIIPLPVNSSIPTAHRKDVSFITVIDCDRTVGMQRLKLWGSIIYRNVWNLVKPWEYAASYWPILTEFIPPLNISAITAEVNKVKDKIPEYIGFIGTKNLIDNIHSKLGVFLNVSI